MPKRFLGIPAEKGEFGDLLNKKMEGELLALERNRLGKKLPGLSNDGTGRSAGKKSSLLIKNFPFFRTKSEHTPSPVREENIHKKDGMKISLQWRDGKMVKNLEMPIFGNGRGGESLKGDNNHIHGSMDKINGIGGDFEKSANQEAPPKKLVGEGKFFVKKENSNMKNSTEGLPDNTHSIDLSDILGVKNNPNFGQTGSHDSFDMLMLENTKSTDTKSLVGRITDYLIQNGIKNLDFLEVVVDHQDLGKFKIDAQKVGNNGQVDLKIEVISTEGRDFFQQNEALLAKDLASAGVNVQDLKIIDSRENVLLSSFLSKDDNAGWFGEKGVQNEDNEYQQENRENKKDERRYRSKEELVSEEEGNDRHR